MNQIYCSSDWHGCKLLGEKVLKYLDSSDKLYFLGDAIDRGPDSIKLFNLLIQDSRIIFIKGNHEAMMSECIPYIWEEIKDINIYNGKYYNHWYQNGGDKTASAFWSMTKEEIFEIKNAVDKMPTELKYRSPAGHTVIMEHAGYTPFDIPHRSHDPLWDREHFYDNWVSGCGASEMVRDTYLIHGHTPVQYLKFMYGYNGEQPLTKEEMKQKQEWLHSHKIEFDWKPTILRYCNRHKICVDMCTVVSGRIALLNLDTFEEIYIDE